MRIIKLYHIKKEGFNHPNQELFDSYWMNDNFKFTFKLSEINKKFLINNKELISTVSLIETFIDFGSCSACNRQNINIVENRTRVKQILENFNYYDFCVNCREMANQFCKNLNEDDSKFTWMKLGVKYHLWENLSKDELTFLKALYYLQDWNRIYNEIIKLEPNYCFKILFKLDKMNLIYYRKEEVTRQIHIIMHPYLKKLIQEKNI